MPCVMPVPASLQIFSSFPTFVKNTCVEVDSSPLTILTIAVCVPRLLLISRSAGSTAMPASVTPLTACSVIVALPVTAIGAVQNGTFAVPAATDLANESPPVVLTLKVKT